jgi:diaminopimelate dehydrogenase
MRKLQVAVIGLGRLGSACANALIDESELALAGVVRRPTASGRLPGRLGDFPDATHVRDLPSVDVALVCVPPGSASGVARELLQARIPIVECASFEGRALEAHYSELDVVARSHRVAAIVGAGWDPGVLQLFTNAFQLLIAHGHNVARRHPGLSLRHSAAVEHHAGVSEALAGEYRGADGALQRYVYVELEPDADAEQVKAAILADPLFAGELTEVFAVDSLSEIAHEQGEGIVFERLSGATSGHHASLLLEARVDRFAFAAQVMLDGARKVRTARHGASRYALDGQISG